LIGSVLTEYKVNLENIFAGPLDLLLYLVRKDEVDIYDISIAKITKQYLEYIGILNGLDLELAGDFLVMAATLMEIKSAMLLPRASVEDGADENASDPRHELIRQLLEYKKFKDAAGLLELKQQERDQIFSRPNSVINHIKPEKEPELDMEQVNIWNLLDTFDDLMRQTGRYQDYSKIKDDTPIDVYQIQILERLQFEGPMTFEHIFQNASHRLAMIGLFLGLLELIRNKLIWAEQPESGIIYLKAITDELASDAVKNAILATEDQRLSMVAQRMGDENETDTDKKDPLSDGILPDQDDSALEKTQDSQSQDNDLTPFEDKKENMPDNILEDKLTPLKDEENPSDEKI